MCISDKCDKRSSLVTMCIDRKKKTGMVSYKTYREFAAFGVHRHERRMFKCQSCVGFCIKKSPKRVGKMIRRFTSQ